MVKQRIIDEASKLFLANGVKVTTMDAIAKHMGISKRTIYENFKDKNELLEACMYSDYEKAKQDETKLLNTDNVLLSLLLYMKNKEKTELNKLKIITDIRRYHSEIYNKVHEKCGAEGIERLQCVLGLGIQQGYFRPDINPKTTAFILSTQTTAFISEQFDKMDLESMGQYEFSMFQALKDLIINFLRGISTPKGIEVIEANI